MSLLQGYYQAIDAEKAATTAQAYAQTGLIQNQAAEVGPNAASARALQGAQTGATQASTGKTTAETAQVAPTALADQSLSGARTQQLDTQNAQQPLLDASTRLLQGAQATNLGANTKSTLADLPGANLGLLQGYAKGGTVKKSQPANATPGKGKPGPGDTVPTMLAPGEGVLNKGAMEHYGSDVLDRMNAMGLKRMGAQSEVAKAAGLPDPHAKGKGKAPVPVVAHDKAPAQSLFALPHLASMAAGAGG